MREDRESFARNVTRKAARRREARARPPSVLLWMRAIGIVGWSIVVPALLGVIVGRWLDERMDAGTISWTLTLLLVGVVIGIGVAGAWVRREGLGDRSEEGRRR